ncbi:type II secretion system protein J [Verrucomicrobiota bacterium]
MSINLYSKRGLTLVEVMIAGAILAFTMSAFLTTFVSAQRSAVIANEFMEKMHEARQLMEELVAHDYGDSELSLGTHLVTGGSYSVSMNSEYSDTKDVTLTLSWTQAGSSRISNLTLTSSITRSMHQ